MKGENITGVQAGEQGMPMGNPMPTETGEKMWDELTDAEKVERMRGVVHNARIRIDRMQAEIDRLERHEHGHTGGMLVPFNAYGSYDVPVAGDKGKWF